MPLYLGRTILALGIVLLVAPRPASAEFFEYIWDWGIHLTGVN